MRCSNLLTRACGVSAQAVEGDGAVGAFPAAAARGNRLTMKAPRLAHKLRTALPCSLALVLATQQTAVAAGPVDAAFVPSVQAQRICKVFADAGHWPIDTPTKHEASLATLDAWAHSHLKRPDGQERMEPRSIQHYQTLYDLLRPKQRTQVFGLLAAMGDVGERRPSRREYDYILIHGTTVQGMRARVMAVAQAVEREQLQITPQTKIIFLDGERTLFASESEHVLLDTSPHPLRPSWRRPDSLPTDERGAAELVWEQLALPDALRHASPVFIHAAKKPGARRAETEDTVAAWSKQNPSVQGTALMVSENPVIEYQRLVTQALLYRNGVRGLHLDAMGPDVRLKNEAEPVRLGYMLDNLAACLHWAHAMQLEGAPLR